MRLRPGRLLTTMALAGTAYAAGRRSRPEPAPGEERGQLEGAGAGRRGAGQREAGQRGPGQGGPGRGGAGQGGQDAPPDVPGVDATSPTEIPAAGWRQILKRAWKEQKEDNISLLAAGVAFFGFTALFPGLIAAITVYGLVADPQQVTEQVNSLAGSLPKATRELLQQQLTSITTSSSGALSFGLVVSLLTALFTASGGVGNLIKAINLAYDEDETRGFLKVRALALLLTLGAILFVVVAVALVAVLPAVLDNVGLGAFGSVVVFVLRWAALIAFMMGALAVLYRYAPDRDAPKFRWVGLGAVVATVIWVIGSAGFSLYVTKFGSYDKTYGALAGVVVLLLWLFLTAFIVLLGAEINSESEQQTARDSTQGPEQPMGERRALKADTVAG